MDGLKEFRLRPAQENLRFRILSRFIKSIKQNCRLGGGFDEEGLGENPGLTRLPLKDPFIPGDILNRGEAFALFKIHHPVDHQEWIGLGEYRCYLAGVEMHSDV